MELNCLKVRQWEKYPGLIHGFLGRRGGHSRGPYAGLNLSLRVGDEPQHVTDNMCDMKAAIGIHAGRVITMKQVHGDEIVEIKDPKIKEAGEADAMMTASRNAYLGVLTADCVPILLLAPDHKLVAAVHAGWRGTLAEIAGKTVRRFKDAYGLDADRIEAALGPAIGGCCYEVRQDVTAPLIEKWGGLAKAAVEKRGGKEFVDLRRLNRSILAKNGIPANRIFEIGGCTSCAREDYFSYRRERRETGRQISLIGFEEEE